MTPGSRPTPVGGPVLLTGFEPFDGRPVNASWAVVQEVARDWDDAVPLVTACLPVSFEGAPRALLGLLEESAPRLVVCVGEAAGRTAVGLERVAVNLADARLPDADGAQPHDVPLAEHGPAAYLTRLPVRACLAAAHATGVPSEVSLTAGTYVCNATFYALLAALADRPEVLGGFVHVPVPVGSVGDGTSTPTVRASTRALRAVLAAALVGPCVSADGGAGPGPTGPPTGTLS